MRFNRFPAAATMALCLICGFTSSSQPTWAQASANKASLVGTVLDPNGSTIPNATVKVRNLATGFTRELTTNEAGQFRGVALDAGAYEVVVSAPGFSDQTLNNVILTVGSAVTLTIDMTLQATATTIEVGETFISDVQTTQSATVNTTAITNLPINGRRFQDFAQLAPTVVALSGTRNQLSFAGQRGINSNVMLDGGDYNQPFFGGIRGGERSNTIITVPQSAVQEFQVVITGYSAEYGRSTGGVMNTITKSGSNELHGEGFWQVRDRALSRQNPIPINLPIGGLQKVTPSETLYQYGGAVGGAIKKNKLFWFTSAEGQNANTPRRVFFPAIAALTPTPATQEAIAHFKSLEQQFDQTNRATAVMGRLDYQFDKGHRLTARYNWSDSIEKNAVSVGGDLNPFSNSALSNEGQELNTINNGALQFTAILSPSIVNDFRFLGSAELRPRFANSASPTLNSTLIGLYGTRSFLPTTQSDKRWQFANALSITRGKHTMKIGGDYNYLTASQSFGFNQFGAFTVNAPNVVDQLDILGLGGNIANRFDSPFVSYSRQIGNTLAAFDTHQLAFFFQDSYRANRYLTLDFGMRYEAQFNPQVDANNDVLLNQVENVRFPIGMSFNPRKIKDSPQQWMPRFGFAWTPFQEGGRTVIRGHAGIFYAATPLLVFAGPNNNFRTPPGDVSITMTSTAGRTVYQAFRAAGLDLNTVRLDSLPVIPIEVVSRAAAFMTTGDVGGTIDPFRNVSVISTAADFTNPRSYQGGLGIETELARNWSVGVQFNYVNTVRLMRNRNYNLQAPVISPTDQSRRPNFRNVSIAGGLPTVPRPVPGLNLITLRDSSARQMYRSFVFSSQYRRRKLQIQSFYTWAENFSDDDNERDAGGFTYTDSFNLRQDYGHSNLDIRHSFVANGVYSLPWGFEIGGIGRYRTGTPINPIANVDLNQDGNNNDRPYRIPGEIFRRNSFRNRDFKTVDLRVMKNFTFQDRYRVQLSAEFFNLFNFDNVVFARQANIYGPGLRPDGTFAPVDSRFMNPFLPNGQFNANTTEQLGKPLQAQFGLRFFF